MNPNSNGSVTPQMNAQIAAEATSPIATYHVCEPELKKEFDPAVYDEQVGMMEMVLDVDDIVDEMSAIRNEYCKYL